MQGCVPTSSPGGSDIPLPISGAACPRAQRHPIQLRTTTTAAACRDFTEDRLWLNGEEVDAGQPRLQACLREGELCWGGWGHRATCPVLPYNPILAQ